MISVGISGETLGSFGVYAVLSKPAAQTLITFYNSTNTIIGTSHNYTVGDVFNLLCDGHFASFQLNGVQEESTAFTTTTLTTTTVFQFYVKSNLASSAAITRASYFPTGLAGTRIWSGRGAPPNGYTAAASVGDFYLDLDTGILYGPKV
jgi:hypothetical protein